MSAKLPLLDSDHFEAGYALEFMQTTLQHLRVDIIYEWPLGIRSHLEASLLELHDGRVVDAGALGEDQDRKLVRVLHVITKSKNTSKRSNQLTSSFNQLEIGRPNLSYGVKKVQGENVISMIGRRK